MAKAHRRQIRPARSESDLEQLEAAYRILDLYIWLSFRMEAAFTGAPEFGSRTWLIRASPCRNLYCEGEDIGRGAFARRPHHLTA